MQGHTFVVVANSNPQSEHIAVSDEQCVLHVSKQTLVLARKVRSLSSNREKVKPLVGITVCFDDIDSVVIISGVS